MPIVLGLASSHAPSMFVSANHWPTVHRRLTGAVTQPRELAEETPEVIETYVRRVQHGLGNLRAQLQAARPDAVIIIGDDQNEVFSNALIPAFALFVGQTAEGTCGVGFIGEKPEEHWLRLRCQGALAKRTLEGLLARGFDVAYSERLVPLARPELGLGHAFTRIAHAMALDETDTPVIPLFVNAYHPPLPSAARCYALGQALREVLADCPERVVVYGSGGLSHDPLGPRAGWVDEPLDHWVLERIARGEGRALQALFTIDSDSLRGGTGEIRSWIAVAGACDGRTATIVDYIPARHAVTGLGFAYWNEPG